MFYLINKVVGAVVNPLGLALIALVLGAAWGAWRRSWRVPGWIALASVVWLWTWGTNAWTRVVGLPLERGWELVKAEDAPVCDAIVLLGGGMSAAPAAYPYADMHSAADRVWHAARLYRAGKAPVVVPTGFGDRESTVPLLRDLGVPQNAIVGEYAARNTEENARFVQQLLNAEGAAAGGSRAPGAGAQPNRADAPRTGERCASLDGGAKRRRVLLVTSAWHMKRALLMYRRYAPNLEIVPAPADFDCTVATARFELRHLLPTTDDLARNGYMFKELLGYWGYQAFRR